MKSPEADSFILAKHFRWANRLAVHHIVIHSAETPEAPTIAEALGRYAHTMAPGRKASWHYAVDQDSIVQCVEERHVAYAAPGANTWGIQIELAGRARQSRDEWLDEFSRPMLDRAAVLVGAIAVRWGIPLRFVDCDGLMLPDPERGVTTHWEVTKGPGKGRTTHVDPGPHFPMDYMLELACASVGTIPALSEVEHA